MRIYRVTFTGHRIIPNARHVEEGLDRLIEGLMREKEYVEFYVGRHGDFDIYAASAVKRAQARFDNHNSTLILVQPYKTKDDVYYENFYDELCYPIKAHPKAAITKRNQWLVDNVDLLIAYVENGRKGGSYTMLKYAEKQEIEIINIATECTPHAPKNDDSCLNLPIP